MPFRVETTDIPGVLLIEPRKLEDDRGFFMETYRRSDFDAFGVPAFVQDNHSRSCKGTLRGLHFQKKPHAQGKLVRVLSGEIYDVAVDLRKGSPWFAKAQRTVLSAENRMMVYVPPWCAHGFCVLSELADVAYKTTAEYAREFEAGIAWDDPRLGLEWPVEEPTLSGRDRDWPPLEAATTGFDYAADPSTSGP